MYQPEPHEPHRHILLLKHPILWCTFGVASISTNAGFFEAIGSLVVMFWLGKMLLMSNKIKP